MKLTSTEELVISQNTLKQAKRKYPLWLTNVEDMAISLLAERN
jgi:hypothetical protein